MRAINARYTNLTKNASGNYRMILLSIVEMCLEKLQVIVNYSYPRTDKAITPTLLENANIALLTLLDLMTTSINAVINFKKSQYI